MLATNRYDLQYPMYLHSEALIRLSLYTAWSGPKSPHMFLTPKAVFDTVWVMYKDGFTIYSRTHALWVLLQFC